MQLVVVRWRRRIPTVYNIFFFYRVYYVHVNKNDHIVLFVTRIGKLLYKVSAYIYVRSLVGRRIRCQSRGVPLHNVECIYYAETTTTTWKREDYSSMRARNAVTFDNVLEKGAQINYYANFPSIHTWRARFSKRIRGAYTRATCGQPFSL